MRSVAAVVAVAVGMVVLGAQAPGSAADDALPGFGAERAAAQRALEARFDAALEADNLRDWLRQLSSRPHHVGSPFGREVAEFVAERFRSWGYDTGIETFHVARVGAPRSRVSSGRPSGRSSTRKGCRPTPWPTSTPMATAAAY
jgi:hypothetical protein